MSIVVQCPHCETKFSLSSDMAGKTMRCPNFDCRKEFKVKPGGKPTEPPAPLPPEPAAEPAPLAKPKKPAAPPEKPRAPAKPAVVEAEIVEAAVVAPPKVKEVVWSEGADVPPPAPPKAKSKKPARPDDRDEPEVLIPRRRKKAKNRGPLILIGMVVTVVVLAGAAVFYVLRHQGKTEEVLREQAEAEYKKADYAAAQKSFDKLAADYPDGENAPKYKFKADLCALQLAVRAVTNRENPEPAFEKLKAFAAAHKDDPLAKPVSGFGGEILEAGKKLAEDVVAHADDRVKAYREDRAGKSGELDRAEKAVATGRALLPILEPLRAPDDSPLDPLRKGLDDADKLVKRERDRAAAVAKARGQLDRQLSDATIETVTADLAAAGFLDDAESQSLLAAAKGRLRDMVKYEADPAAPRAAPTSPTASLLFVAPVGATRRPPPAAAGENATPSVFFAVARGILYAIDEESGTLRWAVRVGPDVTDPPAVARADLEGGPADLAVVTSNVGGEPAVAGYAAKTGEVKWYQPLDVPDPKQPDKRVGVPAAGPPVVVGTRVFVALRDEQGTVYEFDLTTGNRRGRIRLGQPVGPGLVVRPGTGLMYAAADARRVYVIDAGARDDDGNRRDPACVQVIATNHPAGTLRTPPVLLGPEGELPGDRWMILAQTDGELRAFPLQPIQPPPADGKLPPETPATPAARLPLDGWVWFPPAADGERLGVVTDRGQFRLFGVNQPGNTDRVLFPLPSPALPAPPDGTAVRGLVFPAEESAFWVMADGHVQKFRLALIPSRGPEVVPAGPRLPIGEPTQPPQLNNRRDAACLVVRSLNSAGCKAVLMNLGNGELRWQRQLGVVPAAVPIPQDGGVLLVAEDGGLVYVPSADSAAPGRVTVAPPAWVVAAAPDNVTSPTAVAASADGKFAFTLTQITETEKGKPSLKYLIRRVADGRVVHEGTVDAPGPLAGPPVVLGDSLLVPAADGFVHRHTPGTGRANPDTLTAGPPWAADRRADAACSVTVVSDTTFLTNDGGKKLNPWSWPKTGNWSAGAGTWELRERPAGPGVVLPAANPGDPPRLLIADVAGSVWVYAADRGGQPLRRWRPGTGLPAGEPTSPFVVQPDAAGRPVLAYTVKKRFVVCLDPSQEAPKWAVPVGDDSDAPLVGAPQPAGAGRWLATDLAGRVTLLDANGGKAATLAIGLPGAVPAVAAGVVGGSGVLAPLSDGSAVVLPLAAPAPAAPEPKPKEKERGKEKE